MKSSLVESLRENLDLYLDIRHKGRKHLINLHESVLGVEGDNMNSSILESTFEEALDNLLKSSVTLTKYLVTSMLAESRAYPGWLGTRMGEKQAADMLFPTKLRSMVSDCQAELDGLHLPTVSPVTQFSIDNYRMIREKSIIAAEGEIVSLLGLNGCGKTTAVDMIHRLANNVGITNVIEKFPRKDNILFSIISQALAGKLPDIPPEELQMLFIADGVGSMMNLSRGVTITDRIPFGDGIVFPANELVKHFSLLALAFVNYPLTIVVVDRNPLSCSISVKSRPGAPRIFERDIETMVNQQLQLYRLLNLPGLSVVNVDTSGEGREPAFYALTHIVWAATIASGVFARQLVKQNPSISFVEAQRMVVDQYYDLLNGIAEDWGIKL